MPKPYEGACPACGKDGAITEAVETHAFKYGLKDPVDIEATHPVMDCAACGETFTDWRGEEAKDSAVQAHLATGRTD